ncbi:MAG: hypothetical protein SFU91_11525 [Chloroherpetonaceae bacterium]|nr:hypothetical protein [Chloroherpetonaceae bacterium]
MDAFDVQSTDKEIIIRLNKTEIPVMEMINILTRLRLEYVAQKSELTPESVQRIADEIDEEWWQKNGENFLKNIKK